jgi:carotenoid cleavage dioxygenase
VYDEDLEIEGELPPELDGIFVQNGPNPRFFRSKSEYHPFEGDGMLHAVYLSQGRASYRNRYVQTEDLKADEAAGACVKRSLCEEPEMNIIAAGRNPYRHSANTSVLMQGTRAFALHEFGPPYEIEMETLETIGIRAIGPLSAEATFTAHPKKDPTTGELHFFRYSLGPNPHFEVGTIGADGSSGPARRYAHSRVPFWHDFAVSERHLVFFDTPFEFDPNRGMRGHSSWTFRRDGSARILLVPKHAEGPVHSFEIEPCCVMHTVSAHEAEPGRVLVVRAVRYPDLPPLLSFGPRAPEDPEIHPQAARGLVHEWKIDLETGSVSERTISRTSAEFPRLNEAIPSYRARFAYLCSDLVSSGVLKVDLETGEEVLAPHGKGRYGMEFVFVPRRNPVSEDDGYLIGYVWNCAESRSDVDVFDARNLERGVITRVKLKQRVPFGFHSTWIPRGSMKERED